MQNDTPTQALARELVDDLDEFVRSRRAEGRSWRRLSSDLCDATNGRIDVTDVTLRAWYGDRTELDGAA